MGPNIRFAPGEYWDFWTTTLALSDRSVREAVELAGFDARDPDRGFLPLHAPQPHPQHPLLVELYLQLPARTPRAWEAVLPGRGAMSAPGRGYPCVPATESARRGA